LVGKEDGSLKPRDEIGNLQRKNWVEKWEARLLGRKGRREPRTGSRDYLVGKEDGSREPGAEIGNWQRKKWGEKWEARLLIVKERIKVKLQIDN